MTDPAERLSPAAACVTVLRSEVDAMFFEQAETNERLAWWIDHATMLAQTLADTVRRNEEAGLPETL